MPWDLKALKEEEQRELIVKLLKEQVLNQRDLLRFWRDLTQQAAQIDTGYIAQHLVSLITRIPGSSMRGKGYDLIDGSEVKSANFIDSLDKRGSVGPRWNFQSNNESAMLSYLEVPAIYLVSLDLNEQENFRARVWRLDPRTNKNFNERYREWMERLGLPKLKNPLRPSANFQLFPPRCRTDQNFARHGNGRLDGFQPIVIELEDGKTSKKILHAEEQKTEINILTLDSD
jgi:hypothetical protein